MIRPAIAEQENVGDLVFTQEIVEEYWPVVEPPAEIAGGLRPVDAVAGANVDSLNLGPALAHGSRELMHERSGGALQEQERPALWPVNCRPWSSRGLRRRRNWSQEQTQVSRRPIHWVSLLK